MIDPETPEQWQVAVDAAQGALALDSARLYGLVTGGPEVDVGRCEEILRRGRQRGVLPSPDAIVRFTLELMAEAPGPGPEKAPGGELWRNP